MRVGVVGIGGLGQMGIQLARAMGNTVTAISTSPRKEAAAREIGADSFVVSTSKESMAAAAGSLDLILNTVSATHDVNTYLPLLVSGKCLRKLEKLECPIPGGEGGDSADRVHPAAALRQPGAANHEEPGHSWLHHRWPPRNPGAGTFLPNHSLRLRPWTRLRFNLVICRTA